MSSSDDHSRDTNESLPEMRISPLNSEEMEIWNGENVDLLFTLRSNVALVFKMSSSGDHSRETNESLPEIRVSPLNTEEMEVWNNQLLYYLYGG